jgi:hypothetical protein
MKHSYRKISLKQNRFEIGIFSSILILTSIAIEVYFVEYMVTHGLENKIQKIHLSGFNFEFPILYLAIAGVIAVLLCSWIFMIQMPFTKKNRGYAKTRKSIFFLKMLNATTFILLFLCIFLFLPNILGSNWALKYLFLSSDNIPFVKTLIDNFYNIFFSFINISAIWKYFILQIFTCFALAISSLFSGARNIRN